MEEEKQHRFIVQRLIVHTDEEIYEVFAVSEEEAKRNVLSPAGHIIQTCKLKDEVKIKTNVIGVLDVRN